MAEKLVSLVESGDCDRLTTIAEEFEAFVNGGASFGGGEYLGKCPPEVSGKGYIATMEELIAAAEFGANFAAGVLSGEDEDEDAGR